jgi:hypothetical protein
METIITNKKVVFILHLHFEVKDIKDWFITWYSTPRHWKVQVRKGNGINNVRFPIPISEEVIEFLNLPNSPCLTMALGSTLTRL